MAKVQHLFSPARRWCDNVRIGALSRDILLRGGPVRPGFRHGPAGAGFRRYRPRSGDFLLEDEERPPLKALWKKIGKTALSISMLIVLIPIVAVIIAYVLRLVFGVVVKD